MLKFTSVLLLAAFAGQALAQPSAEPPLPAANTSTATKASEPIPVHGSIRVSKVTSIIPDGAEWLTGADACPDRAPLRWNIGKGAVVPARLVQPIRNELRLDGVSVGTDTGDSGSTVAGNDLTLEAAITNISARLCGEDGSVGSVKMTVTWLIRHRTGVDGALTDVVVNVAGNPAPLDRILDGVMTASVRDLVRTESVRRLLRENGALAPAAVLPARGASVILTSRGAPADDNALYGGQTANGDFVPHPQSRLSLSEIALRGMSIPESVKSVVLIVTPSGLGSGFLVSRDGMVLTAAHVVGPNDNVRVRWSDGVLTAGKVIRRDNRRDVALVRTDPRAHNPLPIRTATPSVGEAVYAIGAPVGLQGTVTRGIVSAERSVNGFRFLQSDATINHGNSGGPLIDEHGEVVAIADMGDLRGPGLYYFVPMNDALSFLGLDIHRSSTTPTRATGGAIQVAKQTDR